MKTPALAAVGTLVLVLTTACGSDGGAADDAPVTSPGGTTATGTAEPGATAGGDLSGTLTVFAAASLTEVFDELESRLEAQNPELDVEISYAGSSDLAAQLLEGAPADVFASADEANMQRVLDEALVADPVVMATNTLTVVTPPDDPAGVASFADLAGDDVDVVICAPQVPCGAATVQVEEATGVTLTPVSEEGSVTDVLGKVTSGEADAGVVYVTDATRAGSAVRVVEVPEAADVVNTYPVAMLDDAPSPEAAQAFVDLVVGPEGQEVLAAAGFGPPST